MMKAISLAMLSVCLLPACQTQPTLPSTTYLDGSKGKGLPSNMSPSQRLAFVNQKMMKNEVIDVMGFPHASGSFPPNIECMLWSYQQTYQIKKAIVLFRDGRVVSSNPDALLGCSIFPHEIDALIKNTGG